MSTCGNGHKVPQGQKFCGRCGSATEPSDPTSDEILAVDLGPEDSEAGAVTPGPDDVEVGDEPPHSGGAPGMLRWISAPEHGRYLVLGLVAVIVLLIVGVAVVTSDGGGGSGASQQPESDPGGSGMVSMECDPEGEEGTNPPGTDLVEILATNGDDEIVVAARFDDTVRTSEDRPVDGAVRTSVDFTLYREDTEGDLTPAYSLFASDVLSDSFSVRPAAIADDAGQGGGFLDPTGFTVDLDDNLLTVTAPHAAFSQLGDSLWVAAETLTEEFRAENNSSGSFLGFEQIGRDTCPPPNDPALGAP